jgi:hypothetical protein
MLGRGSPPLEEGGSMKDLHNHIEVVSLLDPIAVTSTQTITDIDLAGWNSAELVFAIGLDAGTGLSASHKIVWVLSDSPDGTTYTAVTTAKMLGVTVSSGVILTIDATDEDNLVYQFGYIGGERYLQLVGTVTGTISMPTGILLVKGHGQDKPAI